MHFEEKEGHTVAHAMKDDVKGEEEEILGGKTTEESMNEIVDAQKRMLDQWCFAEHYESKVLLQVGCTGNITPNAPITTKVVCFSRLLKCLRSLYGKQCIPRSYRSSLFRVHAVCFYT